MFKGPRLEVSDMGNCLPSGANAETKCLIGGLCHYITADLHSQLTYGAPSKLFLPNCHLYQSQRFSLAPIPLLCGL